MSERAYVSFRSESRDDYWIPKATAEEQIRLYRHACEADDELAMLLFEEGRTGWVPKDGNPDGPPYTIPRRIVDSWREKAHHHGGRGRPVVVGGLSSEGRLRQSWQDLARAMDAYLEDGTVLPLHN